MLTASAPCQENAAPYKGKSGSFRRDSVCCLIVFGLSMSVTLLNLLAFNQPKITFLFDAGHYLLTVQKLASVYMSLLQLKPDFSLITSPELFDLINLDGPVLASIHALIFAVAGKIPAGSDWVMVCITQSILQAISSTAIFLIAKRFTSRLSLSIAASLLWIFYAPASFAAGRLLNECLTVTLELSVVFLAMSALPAGAFLLGIASALLFLLKPAVAPPLALVALMPPPAPANRWRHHALIVLGSAAIVGLWLLYTGSVGGAAQLTTNRSPAFNLATGFDIENSAWSTKPQSAFVSLCMDETAPLAMPLGVCLSHPAEVSHLMFTKLARTFFLPWNDCKHSFLGMTNDWQLAMHQFLMFIGLAGLILYAFRSGDASAQTQRAGVILAVMMVGHLIYLLFEPVSRYGFTAVPFAIIFGAYFGGALAPFRAPNWRVATSATAALALVVFFASLANGSIDEGVTVPVKAGPIAQEIWLPVNFQRSKNSALLLVDCDSQFASESASLAINGNRLTALLQPVQCFDSNVYGSEYLMQFAAASGVDPTKLRQWRAAFVPASMLLPGRNLVQITTRTGGAIFADRGGNRKLPSLVQYSITRLSASRSFESRLQEPVLTGARHDDASNASTAPRLRIKLALFEAGSNGSGAVANAGMCAPQQFFQKNVPAGLWDRWMRRDDETLRINRWSLTAIARNDCQISVPSVACSHALCEVSWSMRSPTRAGLVALVASVQGVNGRTFILQQNPYAVPVTDNWQTFSVRELVPTGLLGGAIKSVTLALYPGPWHQTALYGADKHCGDALVKHITIRLSKQDMPQTRLSGARIY